MKIEKFLDFISCAKCSYFAVSLIEEELLKNDFTPLYEDQKYELEPGKNYYVIRNDSSIIAFKMPTKMDHLKLKIILSHTDSPTYKLKENYLKKTGLGYNALNVEPYGGPIHSSWLDRPVSICGRVFFKENNEIDCSLYDLEQKLIIPNTPPHLNKSINDGFKYNPAVDLSPILEEGFDLEEHIANQIGIDKAQIISRDLFLYNSTVTTLGGVNDELIYSAQIDNLECAYGTLEGFMESRDDESILVYGSLDNEEVGSLSTNGASSTFLRDTIYRLLSNYSFEEKAQIFARSFVVSADNAHAINPNHPELFDKDNAPKLHQGVVIKENANLSYTTSGLTKAFLKHIFDKHNVSYQFYANRSDIRGGSTLGRLSLEHLSINSVDIGLAQLAMHSSYEVASVKDYFALVEGTKAFYNTKYHFVNNTFAFDDK